MFLDSISQILISRLISCESVLFNEGFSTEILFQAICRTRNRSICLAFVPFSQLRKGSFNETSAWVAQYAELPFPPFLGGRGRGFKPRSDQHKWKKKKQKEMKQKVAFITAFHSGHFF